MAGDLYVSASYLDRNEKHLTEKPYELRYAPPEGREASNTSASEYKNIKVSDIRGKEDQFAIDRNGFQLCRMETSLSAEDFDDEQKIRTVYLKEVAHYLKQILNAKRVLIFDFARRKSAPDHLESQNPDGRFLKPATIVHIDTTNNWTGHMNETYLQTVDNLNSTLEYKYVNFWKPTKGPVKKWPLMLCDWNSYDPNTDVISRDVVFEEGHLEATMAYYNPNHRFYYASDQQKDEAWVVVQTDSTTGKGVLHTSFLNPLAALYEPERESIEVRAMAYL